MRMGYYLINQILYLSLLHDLLHDLLQNIIRETGFWGLGKT